jgi:hypothetical protein
MRSNEVKIAAVSQNGLAIKYLFIEELNQKICEIAIVQNGLSAEFIPYSMITPLMCLIIVSRNGESIKHIKDNKTIVQSTIVSFNNIAKKYTRIQQEAIEEYNDSLYSFEKIRDTYTDQKTTIDSSISEEHMLKRLIETKFYTGYRNIDLENTASEDYETKSECKGLTSYDC